MKFLGESHPEYLSFYCHIGRTYLKLHQYKKSLKYHQKVLEIGKNFYPDDHQYIAYTYWDFGNIYKMQGRFQEALSAYDQALEQLIRKFGENHWRSSIVLSQKADVYSKQKQYSQAKKLVKNELEILIKHYGLNHAKLVSTYDELAFLYHKLNKNKKAMKNALISLDILNSAQKSKKISRIALSIDTMNRTFKCVGDINSQEEMVKKYLLCKAAEIKANRRVREIRNTLEHIQRSKCLTNLNNDISF